MNTTLLRYILAVVLCGTTVIGRAQDSDYIVNETFETFPDGYPSSCNGWTLFGCQRKWIGKETISAALHIESNKDGQGVTRNGYAITKALGYGGDVYLTFRYATGKGSEKEPVVAKMRVIIQGDGSFENGTKDTLMTFSNPSGSNITEYATYRVFNVTNSTTIKFYQGLIDQSVVIDNVKIRKSYAITLDESEDNSTTISSYKDKLVSATTRTITGGIWNTMCLPFRVYGDVLKLALGDNQDIQLRTFSDYSAGVMSFSSVTEVSAGTPFLIKINETVTNPTFPVVTMKEVATNTVTHGDVSFVGTYNPIDLATDGTNLFLTTRNTLASPASDKNRMNGMRAYIVVPSGFNPSNARIMMDDGETTAISLMPSGAEATPRATYNLKGQRIEKARRGLYVVNGKLTLVK